MAEKLCSFLNVTLNNLCAGVTRRSLQQDNSLVMFFVVAVFVTFFCS